MAMLCAAGLCITPVIVDELTSEAKALIYKRNTSGKAFNMASFIVALHFTMYFMFVKKLGQVEGTVQYEAWKHTWHSEVGKLGAEKLRKFSGILHSSFHAALPNKYLHVSTYSAKF